MLYCNALLAPADSHSHKNHQVPASLHAAHTLGVLPDSKRARTPKTRSLQNNRSQFVLVFAPAAAAQTLHRLLLGRWSQLPVQLAWCSPHHASLRALAPKPTPLDRRRTAYPKMWQRKPRARWTAFDQRSCCVRARRCLAPPTVPLIACLQWSHCQATRPSCAQALPSRSGLGTCCLHACWRLFHNGDTNGRYMASTTAIAVTAAAQDYFVTVHYGTTPVIELHVHDSRACVQRCVPKRHA